MQVGGTLLVHGHGMILFCVMTGWSGRRGSECEATLVTLKTRTPKGDAGGGIVPYLAGGRRQALQQRWADWGSSEHAMGISRM